MHIAMPCIEASQPSHRPSPYLVRSYSPGQMDPHATFLFILVLRYGNVHVERQPFRKPADVIATPGANAGAQSQSWTRGAQVAVDEAEGAAQAHDRLTVLP